MKMREYENLENICIPEDQEKIMDIICAAWESCRNTDCVSCEYRKNVKIMSIMECTALKYSDMLCKSGFRFITLPENENRCVVCGEIIPEGRQVCPVCCKKMDDNRV